MFLGEHGSSELDLLFLLGGGVHPGHNVLDGNPVTLLPDDEAGRPAYLACLPRISETRISSALRTDSAGLIAALGWSTDIGYANAWQLVVVVSSSCSCCPSIQLSIYDSVYLCV